MIKRALVRRGWPVLATLLAIAPLGCSGGAGSLTKLKLKPPAQNALTLSAEQAKLRFPEQSAFNYLYQNSGQQPAGTGETRGQTQLAPDGTIECQAVCSDGREAFAEFQIGADFESKVTEPTPAVVRWLIEYAHQVSAEPTDDAETEASLMLMLIVRDQLGHVLAQVPLNKHSSQDGQTSWSGFEEQALHVVLEPNTRYYALLAGRVDAKAREGANARAQIECRKTALDVALQPGS